MKTVAAVLLTIALALFPLSGPRMLAAVHADGHAATQPRGGHDLVAAHEHGVSHAVAAVTTEHSHAGHTHDVAMDDTHAPPDCGGDHASSSCCSLSCHAMVHQAGMVVSARSHVAARVGPAVTPLPRGVAFDSLLRPPRPA